MANINITDLQAGMELAEDAVIPSGRVLLKAGVTLTDKHLKTFKTWGLTEANIKGISREELEASAAEQTDPLIMEEAEKTMQKLFQHTDLEHPAIAELYRLCKLDYVEKKKVST